MAEPTDREAIRASLQQPARFGAIFDRHAPAVYRYARRRVGEDLATDVTSEVFTRAFSDRRRFDQRSDSALPWLLGIATNLIRMHHRGEERRLRAYDRAGGLSSTGTALVSDVDSRLEAQAAAGLLADALAQLPAQRRDVLLLSAWAELTPAEIAVALGLPPGTVRSELHRARTFVAAAVSEQAPHLVPDQEPTP